MEVLAIEKEHYPELSNIYEQGIANDIEHLRPQHLRGRFEMKK
ncbi:hypothetical protein BN1195_04368 [Chryseobacterium oranimense G311]|nr:hypothetical protein BN1195_04368 [Chryseobacterium oranimense G311]